MTRERRRLPRLLGRAVSILTPREPATLDALVTMAGHTAAAVEQLHRWAAAAAERAETGKAEAGTAEAGKAEAGRAGDDARVTDLRAVAVEAGRARRLIAAQVAEAFLLPLDPEELLEISERLEAVTAAAYLLCREAELLRAAPSPDLRLLGHAAGTAGATAGAVALPVGDPCQLRGHSEGGQGAG